MKTFWASMIILAVLIGGGIASNSCLDRLSKQLLNTTEEVSEFIDNEEFDKANEISKEMSDFIDKKKPLLASILNHENIDDIEQNISELMGYTKGEKLVESQVSAKKLKHMFQHLPENYRLELQNVL